MCNDINNVGMSMEQNEVRNAIMAESENPFKCNIGVVPPVRPLTKETAPGIKVQTAGVGNLGDAEKAVEPTAGEVLDLSGQMPYEDIQAVKAEFPDFESMLPEEDVAVNVYEEGEEDACAKMKALNYFSPVRGMANIRNIFNDKLYAQVCVDEELNRTVEFCQQYQDGSFSPVIKLPQSEMRIAARAHFEVSEIKESALRNEVAKFVVKAYKDYYGKTPSGEELDIVEVLNVLYYAIPQLPVKNSVPAELSGEALYRMMLLYISDCEFYPAWQKSSYYLLDAEGIEKLAHKMKMKRLELLRQLDKHNFLYRTPSSDGYQTNVRIKEPDGGTSTEWFYCIYKLKFFAGIKEKERKFDF